MMVWERSSLVHEATVEGALGDPRCRPRPIDPRPPFVFDGYLVHTGDVGIAGASIRVGLVSRGGRKYDGGLPLRAERARGRHRHHLAQ